MALQRLPRAQLALLDVLGLPFVVIPALWVLLTRIWAALFRVDPGATMAEPLGYLWVFLLTIAWAWLHLRLRQAMDRQPVRVASTGVAASVLTLLLVAAWFVAAMGMMIAQMLLWKLLGVSSQSSAEDRWAVSPDTLLLCLSFVMILVPFMQSTFRLTRGHLPKGRY
ncbi:MAG: hypothetical protein AAF495_23735 [Pseudomonadota bacterium]